MVKTSGKHWRSAIGPAVALVIVLGGPALVQGQLFPNRNIRRERPPCIQEPPFYPQVRQQYYGYYPTCWRRFPPGWACPCPNPELPNWQASLEKHKLDVDPGPKSSDKPEQPLDDPDRRSTDPATDPRIPAAPDDGMSPFERRDPKPDSPPPAGDPFAPGGVKPRAGGLPPQTEVTPSPTLRPASEVASAPPTIREAVASPSEVPPLALTDDEPAGSPSMPDAPPANLPGPGPSTLDATPTPAPLAPTVQAPARRSILGNLFNRSRRR